ncbi:uncharacterized protein LOC117341191 [Pecten maximus]|uniref:uncharacterized protein LOC117341191 n=1 Tax=Pecten maximus TaxID=6579 RepID=UPI001458449D|nr:uncharacterized protein LOC117341191 [Pecten maximus]
MPENLINTPSKTSFVEETHPVIAESESHDDYGQSTFSDAFTQTVGTVTDVSTIGTQWCDGDLLDHTYRVRSKSTTTDTSTQTSSHLITTHVSKGVGCSTANINMSCDKISTDADSLLYTGLTLQVFLTFISVFQNIVTPFKFTMDVADQLLLFLMRLRLNLLFADLGH